MHVLLMTIFTWLSPFLGRFHPLFVHLPIGILMIAYIMELVGRYRRSKAHLKKAVPFVLGIGALSAVFAAVSGYLLSQSGEYSADSVFWHQWTGIGTAVLAISTYLLRRGKYFFIVFTCCQVAVIVAGHLGGQLTHGSDYLTENLPSFLKPAEEKQEVIGMEEAEIFSHVILPILDKNCKSCHNESKMKGELILTSYEELLKGGENGDVVTKGNAAISDMIKRIYLPEEHDDAMPPEGKKRLSEEEIELLEFWINSGLDNNTKVEEMALDERLAGIIEDRLDTEEAAINPVFEKNISKAATKDIEALTAAGFTVTPLADGSPFLQVAYFNRLDSLTKEKSDLLTNVADQVVWFDISGVNVTDWAFLSNLTNLVRLHLKTTSISDQDLSLIDTENLEHLNLFETGITTASIEKIKGLKQLKTLYIAKTSISTEDLSSIFEVNPELVIDIGGKEALLMTGTQLFPPTYDLAKPFIDQPIDLEINSIIEGTQFYYTTDGSIPDDNSKLVEAGFIKVDRSTEIKVIAYKEGWEPSEVITIPVFYNAQEVETATISTAPSIKYPANGGASLLDRNLGSASFDDGSWLGFEGYGTSVTLDLGQSTSLNKVSVVALEDLDTWIFLPKAIEILISDDGKNFRTLKSLTTPVAKVSAKKKPSVLSMLIANETARYVKVKVESIGECPSWHPGSGKKSWIFLNEIIIE